jgi:glycosyltransferase involved in cell wall biosynthesis
MKIAYINADGAVPVFGTRGCSVHVQEVLLAMLKRGDEVHLFTTRIGDEAPSDVTGLQIHPLPKLPRIDLIAPEQAALAALATNDVLRNELAKESEEGAFDLIYERYSLWSCAGMEFACEQNVPSVLEVNAPLIEEESRDRTLLNRGAAEDVAMRAFRCAGVITVVSRQLAHIIEQHPTARGKVHVVPNAVNPQRFVGAIPSLAPKGGFVIGFVGTLRGAQGLTTLVESFAMVAQQSSSARLLIVGDGPEHEALERDIASRGLGARAQLAGAVSPELVPGLLASVDVAVAPYPRLAHLYVSPLKLYEYMAAGLPIVASRIGQIEEAIEHGVTGILVPPGDAVALARAICELERDAAARARLGQAARQAVQQHTWDDLLAYVLSLVGLETVASAATLAVR